MADHQDQLPLPAVGDGFDAGEMAVEIEGRRRAMRNAEASAQPICIFMHKFYLSGQNSTDVSLAAAAKRRQLGL